ncbi:hypothetical protein NKJ46_31645, partial [Mesorhizobium sp. M0166]|uniref:hypothetical protein n=1 Tax=Mesorhizobium sp. M0166 TaxID=2956902 RepID=UPI00333D7DE9
RDLHRISQIRQNHNLLKSLNSFWNGHLDPDELHIRWSEETVFADGGRLAGRVTVVAILETKVLATPWSSGFGFAARLYSLRVFLENPL